MTNRKARTPRRRCPLGKTRYPDHAAAVSALRTITERSTRTVKAVRVYDCDACKGWHLTSQPRPKDQA